MEEWLLFSFNATPAPSPIPLSLCVSLCRETACSHELKINHVTERGQLYHSCITYGSVCFSSFIEKEPQSTSIDVVLERPLSSSVVVCVSSLSGCAICWNVCGSLTKLKFKPNEFLSLTSVSSDGLNNICCNTALFVASGNGLFCRHILPSGDILNIHVHKKQKKNNYGLLQSCFAVLAIIPISSNKIYSDAVSWKW